MAEVDRQGSLAWTTVAPVTSGVPNGNQTERGLIRVETQDPSHFSVVEGPDHRCSKTKRDGLQHHIFSGMPRFEANISGGPALRISRSCAQRLPQCRCTPVRLPSNPDRRLHQ